MFYNCFLVKKVWSKRVQNLTSLCYATFEKTDHENTQFQCPVTNVKHEKVYIIDMKNFS